MKCNNSNIHELLPDLAAGLATATPEVNDHLRSCAACTETLAEFRKTMALLDEWQAPEPSPYFDTRLRARLREKPPSNRRAGGRGRGAQRWQFRWRW
jgi:anti-sigma factor RsiW